MAARGVAQAARALLGLVALAALAFFGYTGYLFFVPAKGPATVQPSLEPAVGFPGSEGLQQVLDASSAELEGVGLQATLILPDGRMWTGVAGRAHHESGQPMTPAHLLHVGSVTKIYTAALVMDLAVQGLLGLDDPVTRWIDLPQAEAVTVRMLLNHTSGLPSYTEDGPFLFRWFGQPWKRWEPPELLAVIRNRPLKFPPGSRHEYSNTNYLLLGFILEAVTGQPYGRLVQELAGRLGLKATFALTYPDRLPVATGYDQSLFRLGRRNMARFRIAMETGAHAAGAVLATSHDVARFLHALMTGQLLPLRAVAAMQAFVAAPDEDVPAQQGYGLGLRQLVVAGQPLVGHTGTIAGYSAVAVHHAEKGYTLVILSNLSVIDQLGLVAKMQAAIDRLPVPPEAETSTVKAPAEGEFGAGTDRGTLEGVPLRRL